MKRALFFTAFDRPGYLARVLETWEGVRGLDRWHVVARIEPGQHTVQIRSMFEKFFSVLGLNDVEVVVNESKLGVLHHPWVGFNELFSEYDFVVRTEDDLLVSSDILEMFEWGSKAFIFDPGIATTHGFSLGEGGDLSGVYRSPGFNPLVFGTWRDRWESLLGPTWDHDYSTFNGTPGNQAGFDWNLNTRVYPRTGSGGIYPEVSRVRNIGIHGTHSTPENHYDTPEFAESVGPQDYRYVL